MAPITHIFLVVRQVANLVVSPHTLYTSLSKIHTSFLQARVSLIAQMNLKKNVTMTYLDLQPAGQFGVYVHLELKLHHILTH